MSMGAIFSSWMNSVTHPGMHEELGGALSEQLTRVTKGVFRATQCHVQEEKLVKEGGGMFGVMAFVFPRNCYI